MYFLYWLIVDLGNILLTLANTDTSTWTCIDNKNNGYFSITCSPNVIVIHAVNTGKGRCTGDHKTLCAHDAEHLSYWRTICHRRGQCDIRIRDVKRPQCAAGNNPFYLTISHSCVKPVLLIALPVAVLLIVTVAIMVLVCVLRKRKDQQGDDSLQQPTRGSDKSDVTMPSNVKSDHDEEDVGVNYSLEHCTGNDGYAMAEHSLPYSEVRADMPTKTQPADMYDEVRHHNRRQTFDAMQEGEQSTSDQKRSHQMCVNTEDKAEDDITECYSVVNKVQREPDELELHDNPMYDGCLNKL